jgi:hypothetical protein
MSFANRQFGKLSLLREVKPDIFLCKCACGKTVEFWRSQLANWVARDCGCTTRRRDHGHSRRYRTRSGKVRLRTSGEYNSYKNMVERCRPYPVAREEWPNYGGRGIRVCERWLLPHGEGFRNFLADLGPRPAAMTLDRINPNGHYAPDNCRWATAKLQAENRGCIIWKDTEPPPVETIAEMEARIAAENQELIPF